MRLPLNEAAIDGRHPPWPCAAAAAVAARLRRRVAEPLALPEGHVQVGLAVHEPDERKICSSTSPVPPSAWPTNGSSATGDAAA